MPPRHLPLFRAESASRLTVVLMAQDRYVSALNGTEDWHLAAANRLHESRVPAPRTYGVALTPTIT